MASGLAVSEVAARTGVSAKSLRRWRQKHRLGHSLEPGRPPGGPRKITVADEPALRAQVAAMPDATLAEHGAAWAAAGHVPVSTATMSRTLPVGPAAQKKTLIATERDEAARAQWRDEMAAIDPTTLVFLDETSTQTVMTRRRGRAPRGTRVVGVVPRNHGPNITCLMAIGPAGVLDPCVFEGAVDGPLFRQWLTTWLLPTLPAGTTIVLDNLSVHRSPAVRTVIEAAGCQLRYLPAYSPDFNPIEQIFAKLKTYLRGAAARTPDTALTAIGEGLNRITAQDIAGCYRHCGFPLPDSEGQHS